MVSWIGDQRNESAAGEDPRLRLAADLVGLIKGLLGRRAERTDENAAFAELLPQRRRTFFGGRRHNDPVERRLVGPAERAVARADEHGLNAEGFQSGCRL